MISILCEHVPYYYFYQIMCWAFVQPSDTHRNMKSSFATPSQIAYTYMSPERIELCEGLRSMMPTRRWYMERHVTPVFFLSLSPLHCVFSILCLQRMSVFWLLFLRKSSGTPYPGNSNSSHCFSVAPMRRAVCHNHFRCLYKLFLTLLSLLPNHFTKLRWWSDTSQGQRYSHNCFDLYKKAHNLSIHYPNQ